MPRPTKTFDSRVDRSAGPSACWPWMGGRSHTGYGVCPVNGKGMRAHRLAWEAANGPVPDGLYVCHRCDNRLCCNPSHLFVGTASDNMRDMVAKGRGAPRGVGRQVRGPDEPRDLWLRMTKADVRALDEAVARINERAGNGARTSRNAFIVATIRDLIGREGRRP